jgi:biotin transporter BioY
LVSGAEIPTGDPPVLNDTLSFGPTPWISSFVRDTVWPNWSVIVATCAVLHGKVPSLACGTLMFGLAIVIAVGI